MVSSTFNTVRLKPVEILHSLCYDGDMQKIATRVFIGASVAFGILGIIQVLTMPDNDNDMSDFNRVIMRLLMASVFIILSSFALSIAGKYLKDR
jgi:hypothetical protein